MSLYDGLDIGKEDGGSTKPVGKTEYWKLCVGTVLNELKKRKDILFPFHILSWSSSWII